MKKTILFLLLISAAIQSNAQEFAVLVNAIKHDQYSLNTSNFITLARSHESFYYPEIDFRIIGDGFNIEFGYEKHYVRGNLRELPNNLDVTSVTINNLVLSTGIFLWQNERFRLNVNGSLNFNISDNSLWIFTDFATFDGAAYEYNIPSLSYGASLTIEYFIHHAFFFDLLLGVNRYSIQNDFFHHEGLDKQLFIYTAALRVGYEF